MIFSELYHKRKEKVDEPTIKRVRWYSVWVFILVISALIPFLGLPLAIVLKSDKDKRYQSTLLVSITSAMLYSVWIVTGLITYIEENGGLPLL